MLVTVVRAGTIGLPTSRDVISWYEHHQDGVKGVGSVPRWPWLIINAPAICLPDVCVAPLHARDGTLLSKPSREETMFTTNRAYVALQPRKSRGHTSAPACSHRREPQPPKNPPTTVPLPPYLQRALSLRCSSHTEPISYVQSPMLTASESGFWHVTAKDPTPHKGGWLLECPRCFARRAPRERERRALASRRLTLRARQQWRLAFALRTGHSPREDFLR